jgi:hypothetical protein
MKIWLEKNWRWLPLFTLAALLDFNIIRTVLLNGWHFTYALDDAYISMRMAENIAHGHYGMNAGEYASAASSIIWPFILAPFAWLRLLDFAPLVLNIFFSFFAVYVLTQTIAFIFRREEKKLWPQQALISCLLVPALNMPGLVLLGMEHMLQVWLVLLVASALVQILEEKCAPPRWLYAVLILLPLVRYEGLAVSGVVLMLLIQRGQVRQALIAAAAIAALVGGFGFYLTSLGLAPLPHSALNKLAAGAWGERMVANMGHAQLWLMAMGVFAFVLAAQRIKNHRTTAMILALPVLAQMLVGRIGNGHRFEIYALAFSAVLLLYLHRAALAAQFLREERARSVVRVAIALLCMFYVYMTHSVWQVAYAANDIYLQQGQMAAFTKNFYKKPVAANDIGFVNYKNPSYVLDVVGISSAASRAAVENVAHSGKPAAIQDLIQKQNIALMMVYAPWFKDYVPEGWKVVANLSLARQPVAAQSGTVTIYAAPKEIKAVRSALKQYTPTVPAGVYLDMTQE